MKKDLEGSVEKGEHFLNEARSVVGTIDMNQSLESLYQDNKWKRISSKEMYVLSQANITKANDIIARAIQVRKPRASP